MILSHTVLGQGSNLRLGAAETMLTHCTTAGTPTWAMETYPSRSKRVGTCTAFHLQDYIKMLAFRRGSVVDEHD